MSATEPDGSPPAADQPAAGRRRGVVDRWRAAPRWVRWPVVAMAGFLVLAVGASAWLWTTTELPPAPDVDQSAVLLDASGEELAVLAQGGVRLEVPLADVAPAAVDALLAAEDRRFYDHTGVDPMGIGRAVWNNLTEDSTQGGSTITQQLVKNVYLNSDRTVTRKLREAVLAVKLERSEDKDAILERYLNTVYFGRGAYGVEAAARAFFDTSATDLDVEQAALLMGMLRAPEQLDPANDRQGSKERRDGVLASMAATGAIPESEARAAQRRPVEVLDRDPSPTILRAGVAPHFVEHVRAQLVERFGERALYEGGLVVHTTLDITDQRAAEAAVAAHLDDPDDPQAALAAVDRTGAVRAWVGGRDFEALQVDLVTGSGGSGRQPGSTFKPVVLAAHLDAGGGAGERYAAPGRITLDTGGDEPWEVSNVGGSGYGQLTLTEAMVRSVNTVFAQLVLDTGPDAVVEMAERLGVQRPLDAHPSIALGAAEVSPLEVLTTFSTLSRSGSRIYPYTISRVTDRDGDVLWEHEVGEEQVVEPGVADAVSAVLSETPRRGTARRAALDRPMAAKTGTTQDNADAWLAGYTPEYTAVVWVGQPTGNAPMAPIDGRPVQGGGVPAQIWHDFMVEAVADAPPTPFPDPPSELLGDPGRARTVERTDAGADTDVAPESTTTTSTPPPGDGDEDDEGDPDDGDGDDGGGGDGDGPPESSTTTAPPPTSPPTTAPPTTAAPTTAPPEEGEAASAGS